MQVFSVNDVKIYNLSAGKSIPEWLNSEARRKAERNVDVRRRVQLIQDFDMPDVSHTVNVSQDGRYVFATGAYKSWLKCYDLDNLSLKFQRGLDSSVIKLISLGDDYSKIILLEEDRFIEMHAAFGRYFRMRMPRYGRDMAFSLEQSDLYLVGASSEIYRLNLELGEWLCPLQTNGNALNCCQFAQAHQLFVCGTTDCQVEAWDHRDRSRVGVLDCVPCLRDEISGELEITSLKFRDALLLGVGTNSGHIMLYDIRSRKPLVVKDHMNGLPIKKIDFLSRSNESLVLSMDGRVLKIWDAVGANPFASIETECTLNDFCRYPDSGLIFFANEGSRMQQFFIPALGTAPKWCYYLESITEELEETQPATLFDDYKFVTKEELDTLGLSRLVGTSVLRAYMHGYFLDRRLYNKAQLVTQPIAFEKYVNQKVNDLMHRERDYKVINNALVTNQPKVNQELAARLRAEAVSGNCNSSMDKRRSLNKKAVTALAILEDDRFKKLFENEDFEVDRNCEQFGRNILTTQKKYTAENDASLPDNLEENMVEEQSGLSFGDSSEHLSDSKDISPGTSCSSETDEETLSEKSKEKRGKLRRKMESHRRHHMKYQEKMLMREAELDARLINKPRRFTLHELDSTGDAKQFLDRHIGEAVDSEEHTSLAAKRSIMQRQHGFEKEDDIFGGRSLTFSLAKRDVSAKAPEDILNKKKHDGGRTGIRTANLNIMRSTKKRLRKLDES